MKISFEKYHGTGNDFIVIDNRDANLSPPHELIAKLCDRHYGIGADGLIMLELAAGYDFAMRYFNADGHESSMCGNGGRCVTAFALRQNIIKDKALFIASDGEHRSEIIHSDGDESLVRLEMRDVKSNDWENDAIFLDTGSPHLVLSGHDIKNTDVFSEGKRLRNHQRYDAIGGTNVDFIENIDHILHIRTYERGVEDETLSCGTGVTAAALAWAIKTGASSPITINTLGGDLKVYFERTEKEFNNIWLEGPASFVFNGQIEV